MTALEEIKKTFPNMFRPLEWHHFDGKTEHGHGEWWAHGSRGMFHIYDVREKFPDDRPFYAKELSDQLDTLEMAQEAVQKRHEMDIVMCLDPGFLSTLESLQAKNEGLLKRAATAEKKLRGSNAAFERERKHHLENQELNRRIEARAEAAEAEVKRLQSEIDRAEPTLWVSPIDLRAWQKAKAGEIWAWSENLEGQCVGLYLSPSTALASTGGEHNAE